MLIMDYLFQFACVQPGVLLKDRVHIHVGICVADKRILSCCVKTLHTEIEIDAPAELTWKVLTDFSEYAEWNPFLRKISGTFSEGCYITVHAILDGREVVFQPGIAGIDDGKGFSWIHNRFLPGLADCEHVFRVTPINQYRSLFVLKDECRGLLVFLIWSRLKKKLKPAFKEMNEALKARVESMVEHGLE